MATPENRTLRSTTSFKAPINLMWEVWSSPGHIATWWGPAGFSTTIHTMDFREGGEWNLTLHGPDGTNFPNRSVFKEIVPQKKILFEHFNPHFITTVLFETQGKETIVDWSLLFDTVEMHDIIVKVHKADHGQKENLERLERYLADLSAESRAQ